MAEVLSIILIVFIVLVVIVVIAVLYRYYSVKHKLDAALITTPISITEVPTYGYTVASTPGLALSTVGVEYTYNMWIKVSEPRASPGTPVCLLYRSSAPPTITTAAANPSIWLRSDNSLIVRASTAQPDSSLPVQPELYPSYSFPDGYSVVNPLNPLNVDNINTKTATCDIENIPLQRWVMITAVLWNKTFDVYINGKLVRSCILPGLPLHDKDKLEKLYVGGGNNATNNYTGHVSRVRYFNHAITAEEVLKLYKKGPAPVTWWWHTMKNKVKVTLDIGNTDDDD